MHTGGYGIAWEASGPSGGEGIPGAAAPTPSTMMGNMPTMPLGHLHHVELYVADLARSKSFYGWLLGELGYAVYQQWDAGVSYKKGETYLVLVQVEAKYAGADDPAYHRCRVGLNHLAFHGESRAQVDALTAQLRERGVTVLYEDKHPYAGGPDYYAVFFEDPDRIKLEIVAPPA